ncbi:MAG TPA: hypothetical protein DCE41_01935, partial [Cytophagales bacterium]|nr:hypothetical protein [Cytophagales bacterium]
MKPFVLFLFLVLALPERFRAPSLQEYVAQNHRVFRLSKPDNAFGDLLAEDIATHQVFFSSEEHAIAGNKVLEISLLRYLVKEAGVKYLLIEHGYCQAQWFAQYLATGDESILRAEVQRLEGTLSHTQEFFRYWQQVYQLNQELTPENKIQVVGIDLGWLPSVHPYVWQQAEGRNLTAFPSLAQFLARYHDSIPQAEWRATFEGIVSEFEANPGHSTFSAEQHFEIPYIFKNMLHSIEAFSQAEHLDIHRKRDGYMYKNFLELYPRLSPGKYLGQWGLNHVYQSPQLEVNWLAARLEHQEDSPVKGQV